MKDTFIFACFGTAIFIDLAFLGGLILAFIDYIKEKKNE